MDDAQKRAANFNADQRLAELEAEVARLRKALEEIDNLDIDEHPMVFSTQVHRITWIALARQPVKPKKTRPAKRKKR